MNKIGGRRKLFSTIVQVRQIEGAGAQYLLKPYDFS
jgi:hypothetical protein